MDFFPLFTNKNKWRTAYNAECKRWDRSGDAIPDSQWPAEFGLRGWTATKYKNVFGQTVLMKRWDKTPQRCQCHSHSKLLSADTEEHSQRTVCSPAGWEGCEGTAAPAAQQQRGSEQGCCAQRSVWSSQVCAFPCSRKTGRCWAIWKHLKYVLLSSAPTSSRGSGDSTALAISARFLQGEWTWAPLYLPPSLRAIGKAHSQVRTRGVLFLLKRDRRSPS